MKKLFSTAMVFAATAGTALAGSTVAPDSSGSNADGALVLLVLLGVVVATGGGVAGAAKWQQTPEDLKDIGDDAE